VGPLLDEELSRLPEKYRGPRVLCYLQDRTHAEAAAELGCPPGSMSRRLARGRELLRWRLERRGVTIADGIVPGAAVPAALARATVRSAVLFSGGAASGPGASLAKGMLQTMVFSRLKTVTAAVLLLGAAVGGGLLAHQAWASREDGEKPAVCEAKPDDGKPAEAKPARADRYGDPLPDGAVTRLGTVRWRHSGAAEALVFSPDGKTLASICWGDLLLWDTATGKVLRQLHPATPGPFSGRFGSAPQFTPDGKTLLAQTDSGDVAIWDVATGKLTRTLAVPDVQLGRREAPNLRLSPDGKVVAVGTNIDTLTLLDIASGKVLRQVGGHRAAIYGAAFSPDGATIALATLDPSVQLWDAATGKLVLGIKEPDNRFVNAVAFSPDGKTIASGSWELIHLSDTATGKEVGRLQARMQMINSLAFTPDGKTVVSGSEKGYVHVWDLETKKARLTLDGRLGNGRSLALSGDGKTVALGGDFNAIRLWDAGTGKELFTEFEGHDTPLDWVAYTPDGKTLISCGFNARLRFWDTDTWKEKRQLVVGSFAVALAPDARRMAAVGYGNQLRVWDSATGKDIFKAEAPESLHGAVFFHDGKALVSIDWKSPGDGGGPHGTAHLIVWAASTGKQVRQVPLPEVNPQSLALTPDDRTAIVGDGEGLIHLVDLEDDKEFLVLHGHPNSVDALALSADGKTLLSGGLDRGVRLWDLVSGHEIALLEGHKRSVATVAYSPDGRLAASAGGSAAHPYDVTESRRIRLWDVVSGKEVGHFEGHGADVTSLAFSPDGTRLVSGLRDTAVLVWDVTALPRPPSLSVRPEELDGLWKDLAGADAFKAHQAVWKLAATPERAVPFLKAHVRPAAEVDTETVRRWIADLDSEQFATRTAAVKELEKLGERAAPALREALAGKPSAEVHKQAEELLGGLRLVRSPEVLQRLRAIQVLERAGSPEAHRILEALATGAPAARETREAKASLDRLARRR
jgi:WD40 repeat protein